MAKSNTSAEAARLQGGRCQVSGDRCQEILRSQTFCCEGKSQALIGKNEGVPGELGIERLLAVKSCQYAAFPNEQVGVVSGELLPCLGTPGAGHALANQKQVRPGDGLVVELCFPLRVCEAPQCLRESPERLEHRVPA